MYSADKHADAAAIAAFVKTVEGLGYDTLWNPETRVYELFTVAGYMLSQSSRLKLGSSIASIYARDAFTSRLGMISLNKLYGDRFILGLGVSHVPIVEGLRGHVYEKPIPAMRAYLNGIAKGQADAADFPIALAALRPLMLKLSAAMTRGALPYIRLRSIRRRRRRYWGRENGWRPSRKSQSKPILARPVDWAARNCRAIWCWIIIGMLGWGWGSPRRICPMAGRMGSSTR